MKKRRNRGFTLAETLVAVLILVMLTGVIAVGTSTATKLYGQLLFSSESDLLASTLNTAMGDVLHYAVAIQGDDTVGEQSVVSFTNPNYGVMQGHLLNREDKIYINTSNQADDAAGVTLLTLVSDGAYTSLNIQAFSIAYQAGVFVGEYTISGAGGTLKKTIPFAFRPLNI